MSTDMDWPDLGTAAIRKAVELTEERDRARAVAAALEGELACVLRYANSLDANAYMHDHQGERMARRIARELRALTRTALREEPADA